MLEELYQTHGRLFYPISKYQEQTPTLSCLEFGLFQVFDVASQTIANSWRNSK